jgi:hypothetical protein
MTHKASPRPAGQRELPGNTLARPVNHGPRMNPIERRSFALIGGAGERSRRERVQARRSESLASGGQRRRKMRPGAGILRLGERWSGDRGDDAASGKMDRRAVRL